MLQVLKQTSLEQLWVTTRPYLREVLEDNLQQLSYTLEPFSEDEQVEFLKKFWHETLNLEDMNQHRLQTYAAALISKLAQSIGDKFREFTSIPLQTRMLAEAFKEEFGSFYHSNKSKPQLPHKLDLLGLYRKFIESKYNIYYEEKSRTQADKTAAEELRERDIKNIQVEHQSLALEALFPEDQRTFLQNDHHSPFSDEELGRIGIVQRNNEGKLQFIHRTFAEYFVAELLVKQLTKEIKQQDLLLNTVLLRTHYQVTRSFLDGLLENSKPSKLVLKEYGEKLNEQWNLGEVNQPLEGVTTELHKAATEDNAHIIGFLLDSLKSEHSNALMKMLLAKDDKGRTACHMAAETNSVQALNKIWEWAEEVTSTLTYSLLLSQDKDSKTAWQLAAEGGYINVVEKLWGWAQEAQINPGELQNKVMLGKDSEGRTAWHIAAEKGSVELIDKLWGWAKEAQITPGELWNKVLLGKDSEGRTAWHIAAEKGSVELIDKLWGWAKELPTPELLKNKLLSRDNHGLNAWHLVAKAGSVEILHKLWDWAKELKLEPEEIRNGVLWSQDKFGQTAWHKAAEGGHIEVLNKVWDWAKELKLKPEEIRNEVLLSQDKFGQTAWHKAANGGHVEVFEKLWDWAKEKN